MNADAYRTSAPVSERDWLREAKEDVRRQHLERRLSLVNGLITGSRVPAMRGVTKEEAVGIDNAIVCLLTVWAAWRFGGPISLIFWGPLLPVVGYAAIIR